jgi:uncharacterized membrane protein
MALRLHEIHPSIVHFPLAIVPTSLALDVIGKLTGSKSLMSTAKYLVPVGAVAGGVVGLAGLVSQQTVHAEREAHKTLVTHRNLNLVLLGAAAVLTGVRMKQERPSWGYLLAMAGGVAAMNYTAYLGGKMVYSHGVGVETSGGADLRQSIEIRRGSYGRAARLALKHIGRGLLRVLKELGRGELAPLLRREPMRREAAENTIETDASTLPSAIRESDRRGRAQAGL